MDIANITEVIFTTTENETIDVAVKSLSDFDLALVGGGCGEVVFG